MMIAARGRMTASHDIIDDTSCVHRYRVRCTDDPVVMDPHAEKNPTLYMLLPCRIMLAQACGDGTGVSAAMGATMCGS